MRISIPSIPSTSTRPFVEYSLSEATSKVNSFLEAGQGKTLIMTGAGVSVDSGIAPYRGEGGHYTVHTTYRPIFYPEFIDASAKGHSHRQRYWSRSFLGFKPVQHATPNPTHYSIAALQRMGYIKEYITQNVDNLHHAATPSPSLAASTILELHGTLQNVVCVTSPEGYHQHQEDSSSSSSSKRPPKDPEMYQRLSALHRVGPRYASPQPHNTPTGEAYPLGCGFRGSRSVFQDVVEDLNPMWNDYAKELRETGKEPKTNPDGDVDLGNNVDYSTFKYPPCPNCGGVLKPAVIFFGESVPPTLRDHSYSLISSSSSLLLVGTSLATYSAFRLVKQALDLNKPVLVLNKGPTRADGLTKTDKIDGWGCGEILTKVARELEGKRRDRDPVLERLLKSGKVISPEERRRGVVSS